MAVITKFMVVRDGEELDQVFDDKKEADAYDKMLDAADHLSDFIKHNYKENDIGPKVIDDIAIFLVKNAITVNRILKGVKAMPTADDKATAAPPDESSASLLQKQESQARLEKKAQSRRKGTI